MAGQVKNATKMAAKYAARKAAIAVAAVTAKILAVVAVIVAICVLVWYLIAWAVNPEPVAAAACTSNTVFDLSKIGVNYVPNSAGYFGPNPTVVNIAYSVGKGMNATDEEILALFVAINAETGFKNLGNDGITHGSEDYNSHPEDLAEAAKSTSMPHDPWKDGVEFGTDHASVGILQQQAGPNFNWGAINDLMNPGYAASTFVTRLKGGPSAQYAGNVPMMVQAVQQSGFSDGSNYAAVLGSATDLFNQAKTAYDLRMSQPGLPGALNNGTNVLTGNQPGVVPGGVSFQTQHKGLVLTNAVLDTSASKQPLVLDEVQLAGPTTSTGNEKVATIEQIVEKTGITTEQATNAQIIAATALKLGYGQKGVLTAIVTALAESSLINVGHGDALGPGSIGLFQQMSSWGTLAERTDPASATRLFFEAPGQGMIYEAPDWQSLEPWDIAQRVEKSEFDGGGHSYSRSPYAQNYKDQMDLATQITAAVLDDPSILVNGVGVGNLQCQGAGSVGPNDPNADSRRAAATLVASPYIRWLTDATKNDLNTFANGGNIVNSCGDPVYMSPYLMNALATLVTTKYTIEIDDFGFPGDRSYCESGTYQHPKGNAVDIQYIEVRGGEATSDGMDGYPGNDAKIASAFATDFLALMPKEADGSYAHGGVGQRQCGLNPTFPPNSVALNGSHLFEDSCDHLHIDVRNRLNLNEKADPSTGVVG